MLATTGPVPGDDGWAFEFKWDGQRAIVEIHGRRVRVFSRTGRDVTAGFPDLRRLAGRAAGLPLVLDGEIVALDAAGLPSYDLLRRRARVRQPEEALVASVPVTFYAFDVLAQGRQDTTALPYLDRRARLELTGLDGPGQVPPYLVGNGADVLDAAREAGLEGVVAKRLASGYHPGQRTRDWVTTPLMPTHAVVVAGWRPGQGRLAGDVGSLVAAAHDRHGRLCWLGNVGTGLAGRAHDDLAARLDALARPDCPLYAPRPAAAQGRDVRWVAPRLVGEVAYRALTDQGRLRHAVWRGLRFDRTAEEVTLESLGWATVPDTSHSGH